MFGQFFNIDESAFSIAPNPKYLYLSKQHEEALAHLVYVKIQGVEYAA